jgi:serine/threonine protein kinase
VYFKGRRSNKEIIGLRRECEIQRHLNHPNIIQMLDSFETSSEVSWFIFMNNLCNSIHLDCCGD